MNSLPDIASGQTVCRCLWTGRQISAQRKTAALQKAQFATAQKAAALIDQYVPFDTGILKNSVNQASKFDEGLLVYNTPYARRQFYLHPEGECLHGENGLRGSYWGQRALADYGEAIAYIATQAVTTFWGGIGHL